MPKIRRLLAGTLAVLMILALVSCETALDTVNVAGSDARLSELSTTMGTLHPDFDPSITRYYVSKELLGETVTITATTSDEQERLVINDGNAVSGQAFAIDTSNVGESVSIEVKSTDGKTSTIYTIMVLPSDFPEMTLSVSNNPADGYIYLGCFSFSLMQPEGDPGRFIMILDKFGVPVWYRRVPGGPFDFKLQPTGVMSYFQRVADAPNPMWEGYFTIMNSNFEDIRNVSAHGYSTNTDLHELLVLPNDNVLLMSYDSQRVDLTDIHGPPGEKVIGLNIQEINSADSLVFEWSSWDHFEISDITYEFSLDGPFVDYVHGNSLDVDADGNIYLSCRHMDEITKIDHETGDIIWRFGGLHSDHREFDFVNDPLDGFSHQHCARVLPNGNILLFDNGSNRTPQISRAVEYELNESAMTANLVWEYRGTEVDSTFANIMGSVQRLDNGNTLICWGFYNETVVEVTPAGEKVFELSLPTFDNVFRAMRTYRAFKYPLP